MGNSSGQKRWFLVSFLCVDHPKYYDWGHKKNSSQIIIPYIIPTVSVTEVIMQHHVTTLQWHSYQAAALPLTQIRYVHFYIWVTAEPVLVNILNHEVYFPTHYWQQLSLVNTVPWIQNLPLMSRVLSRLRISSGLSLGGNEAPQMLSEPQQCSGLAGLVML